MKDKFYPPKFKEDKFHCPHCGVYSHESWSDAFYRDGNFYPVSELIISFCQHCGNYAIWHKEKMIFPSSGTVPLPNSDLPQEILADFNEAREIVNISPRGAAALLRLGIQKLCKHLGQKGKNINDDIAGLVKEGLPVKIQKALDFVRVIGNNSVHPGQIDLKDNSEVANSLFSLINIIAETMITQPKEIDNLYNTLPEDQKTAIKNRDNNACL